jgi:hypothetical protein
MGWVLVEEEPDSSEGEEEAAGSTHHQCAGCGLGFETRQELDVHVSSITAPLTSFHHASLDQRHRLGIGC